MAHEITASDGLVLASERAWHGLGLVVKDAPTPAHALRLAGLDWEVEQWALSATDGSGRQAVPTHVLNVRSDNHAPLGVVTEGYSPTHNHQIASLMQSLSESGSVEVESAGSIRGGRRVWFLARGKDFALGQDIIGQYLLFCTGHDGTLAFRAMPTTIRVVCSNTLHMALGRSGAGYSFRHSGDITTKLAEIRQALGMFDKASAEFQSQARALAGKTMTRAQIQDFWVDVYSTLEETIPANPSTREERKTRDEAAQVIGRWSMTFDRESSMPGYAGGSAWLALNAVTRWYDHQRNYRAAAPDKRDARVYAALWGTGADAKAVTLKKALALV